jgi:hypothetical protein
MSDTPIDFSAPATLRKWPSLNKQRVSASLGARPYMIGEGGTLDECIQQSPAATPPPTRSTPRTPHLNLGPPRFVRIVMPEDTRSVIASAQAGTLCILPKQLGYLLRSIFGILSFHNFRATAEPAA